MVETAKDIDISEKKNPLVSNTVFGDTLYQT